MLRALITSYQQEIEYLAMEMDRSEMQRLRKVLFHEVTEKQPEDATSHIANLVAEHLDLHYFSTSSVTRCYCLEKPLENKPRPLITKFTDVVIRDKVWFAKTKLKGTGVTESEFLAKLFNFYC
ncbi:unnamed protein product [Euphydryas editha]|uniref:Uncharacterized protein n=1 Tax=Euphydryas editha TaxID=104508 RepID=A0AAU9V766_EUPED|nr:unnamed protein product [Euphydryas editha]